MRQYTECMKTPSRIKSCEFCLIPLAPKALDTVCVSCDKELEEDQAIVPMTHNRRCQCCHAPLPLTRWFNCNSCVPDGSDRRTRWAEERVQG